MYRQLKTLFIFPDGDGGWVLKVQTPDGEQLVYPLDLARAAHLTSQAALAVKDLAEKATAKGPA